MKFSQDWFSHNEPTFKFIMDTLTEKQEFLEIGCYEGRATCWMVQNGLDPDGLMTVIDTFAGGEEHGAMGLDLTSLRERFEENINEAKAPDQIIEILQSTSSKGLAKIIALGVQKYDFIYVDGSHQAPDVMTDACMAFELLKPGGIMLFDDYLWNHVPGLLHRPKLAVDNFVTLFAERCELLIIGYQLAVRKN